MRTTAKCSARGAIGWRTESLSALATRLRFLLRRRCIANLSLTESVVEQFSRVLAEPEFECRFRAVVFAILSNPADAKEKFAPFYCLFG